MFISFCLSFDVSIQATTMFVINMVCHVSRVRVFLKHGDLPNDSWVVCVCVCVGGGSNQHRKHRSDSSTM